MRVQLGSKDSKPDTTWSGLDWRLAVWFGALNFENMTISSPLLHVTSQAISACFCPVAMHLQWPICPEAVNDYNKKRMKESFLVCFIYAQKFVVGHPFHPPSGTRTYDAIKLLQSTCSTN